jgi:hypothetical protein
LKKLLSLAFLITLTLILFEVSCTSPTKGCDDPNAVNYSFNADEPCTLSAKDGDCPCSYPRLLFEYVARYSITKGGKDSVLWKDNLVLSNTKQQNYYLKRFSFFVSGIELIKAGKAYSVLDSVLVPIKKSAKDSALVMIRNNQNLLGQESRTVAIGTFREIGMFNELHLTIGLNDTENRANIYNIKMPGSHPLNTDSLYITKDYKLKNGKIWYQSDTLKTTKPQFVWLNGTQSVKVTIPSSVFFKQAQDAKLSLYFDFRKLFEDVDFKNDNATTIEQKITKGFEKAFSIEK